MDRDDGEVADRQLRDGLELLDARGLSDHGPERVPAAAVVVAPEVHSAVLGHRPGLRFARDQVGDARQSCYDSRLGTRLARSVAHRTREIASPALD